MTGIFVHRKWAAGAILIVAVTACSRESSPEASRTAGGSASPPAQASPEAGHPTTPVSPSATPSATPTPDGGAAGVANGILNLQGIRVTVPPEWVVEPFQFNPMAGTVAAYRLARVEGDVEDAILKISHFPSMKGKDTENLARWLGQVQVDRKPISKEAANYKVEEKGAIRLTTLDASGVISTSMMGGGPATPGQRMIAGIIDHPNGPHFVKITGSEKTVARWRDSIFAMMSSATVE